VDKLFLTLSISVDLVKIIKTTVMVVLLKENSVKTLDVFLVLTVNAGTVCTM